MTPTIELRFVERELTHNPKTNEHFSMPSTYRILQQKWVEVRILSKGMTSIVRQEWRDVPLEKENV